MRAITVRPPWSWAIAEAAVLTSLGLDPKNVENRGRKVSSRHVGQDWAIHAGRTWDMFGAQDPRVQTVWRGYWGERLVGHPAYTNLPTGAVVAVATLTDCHQAPETGSTCCPPWGEHWYETGWGAAPAWHLVWANVGKLWRPVPVRGQQPVPWTLPENVAAAVAAQLAEVSRA